MTLPLEIASLGQTWTYDGNAHDYKHYIVKFNNVEVTGTGIVNDTVFVLSTGDTLTITDAPSITNAGKLANTFTYTLQHDIFYIGTRDTVIDTLRVNPLSGVEVTVKEHGGETTYDGYAQRVHGYDLVDINNSLYTEADFHYSGVEDDTIALGRYVGTYQMGILPSDFTNDNDNFIGVTFIIQDDSLVIKPNPMAITITGGSAEKPYDGTPLTNDTYSYTSGVLAAGDTLVAVVEGTITTYGDSLNRVVDYKVFRNEGLNASMVRKGVTMPAGYDRDVTDCYTFNTPEAGHLRITPNGNVKVTITGHTGEFNYDAAIVHHVGGYDIVITDTLGIYTVADFHFTGDSTLDENAVGTYNMNLAADQFVNDNASYDPVTFNVTDGWMIIYDSLIVSDVTVDSVTCKDYNDGKATIIVEGGKRVTSPYYSYDVTGVNTSDNYTGTTDGTISLTGLKPDTYNVTITDALAYTATASFLIEEPALLTADVTVQADLCPNQANYAVEMTTTGGNGDNHFTWYNTISDGAVVVDADAMNTVVNKISANDCDHEYKVAVMVTDRKSCVARDTIVFKVEDLENPVFTAPADLTLCRNAAYEIDAPTSVTGVPDISTFSDNCTAPNQLVVTFADADTTGTDLDRRVIHRVWRVTDLCGRYTEHTQNITIRPAISDVNSTFTCPADIDTVIRHGGCNLKLTDIGMPTFTTTTVLNPAEMVITNNVPSDSIYEVTETIVTWTITDSCGFTMSCNQKIKVSFQDCPDAVDIHGIHYPSVRLGSGCKCWTTENLKSTQYSDGRPIDNVMDYVSPEYPNATENVNIFGHLYNWYAAADTQRYHSVDSVENAYRLGHRIQGICPTGWYLPSDQDFEELNIYPTEDLRSTSYWISTSGVVNTNATGFNSLPGGMFNCSTGRYEAMMGASYYWTCHPVYDLSTGAMIDYICEKIVNQDYVRCSGFSIRCVFDEH